MTGWTVALAVGLALAGPPARCLAAPRLDGVGADPERVRQAIDSHALRTLDGRTLTLGSLRGQVVVANFWASWCPPCRRELPALDRLHAEIVRRGGRVVAVSIDLEARNAERFAKANRLTLPVLHDGPDGLARSLDLKHVPFTMILDRDGSVAFTTSGSDPRSLDRIGEVARGLLAKAPVAVTSTEGARP